MCSVVCLCNTYVLNVSCTVGSRWGVTLRVVAHVRFPRGVVMVLRLP